MDVDEAVRPCWIEIDLTALAHNVQVLRSKLADGTRIIAALKGDAYGHGIGPVARCLAQSGVESLATGNLRDADAIRAAGVDLPILMFAGPLPEGMPALLERGLVPTVHDWISARAVSNAAVRRTGVFVKVDIGLGRLGVRLSDARAFVHELARLRHIAIEGIYTHLSFRDAAGRDLAQLRYRRFDELLQQLAADGIQIPISQALASAGLIAGLESRANSVCPGSLLYGMFPIADGATADYRPVVRAIKSRLIHIGEADDPAGARRVGVLPLGLADGYQAVDPQAPACALLGGRRVPIRGVSLEYIVLDLADVDDARVGDEVVLLGESGSERIRVADIAAWQRAAPHAVMMAFEGRLRARYLSESSD